MQAIVWRKVASPIRICLLLQVCLAASIVGAQDADAPTPVLRLAVGERSLARGVDPALIRLVGEDSTGFVHVIAQFNAPLSATDRRLVLSHVVRLLDPVPEYAYLAVVPRAAFLDSPPFDRAPYYAVISVPSEYKLAPWLRDPIPEHARRGDRRAAVTIQFYGDVDAQQQDQALAQLGLRAEYRLRVINGVQAEVPIDPFEELVRIAEDDRIKWIEPIPPPGEEDNDDVRALNGVDSDAVKTGTAYALSGGGVTIAQWEPGVADLTHGDFASAAVVVVDATTVTDHATHVAATAIGSGAMSASVGGYANQWQGVAIGAGLRGYDRDDFQEEYFDAADEGATISTNSWGIQHCHEVPSQPCYGQTSQFYDGAVSGRRSDGTPSGPSKRMLIIASAGNEGEPERHADNVVANGQYDPGEAIYIDNDDTGTRTDADFFKRVGTPVAVNTPLINFHMNERHDELFSIGGIFDSAAFDPNGVGEIIYRDADDSATVSPGDVRLSDSPFGSAPSVVVAGDADAAANTYLRQFRLWGNTRASNSAKNTVVVGNYLVDSAKLYRDSSRGPTRDGRLKPDVVAPGSQANKDNGVTSAIANPPDPDAPFIYDEYNSTSHATPAVTGVAALLTQWYRNACIDVDPKPSTLRAMLLHSAIDMTKIPNVPGAFVGPDYAYGYGKVDAPAAMGVLPHHIEGIARDVDVGSLVAYNYPIRIGRVQDLKVTLAWDDPPPSSITVLETLSTSLLQNDLDLELVSPTGTVFTPWRFNPADPFAPATPSPGYSGFAPIPAEARDTRNTVEQIVVPDAVPGTWTIRVIASRLDLPEQDFSVVGDLIDPALGPCLAGPATDVWLRDNPADTGTTPSTGQLWLSPDVWNRVQPDNGTVHENPQYGGDENALYVRLHNRSASETARATSIDVWLAQASTGLVWPDSFSYVGRLSAPNLPPGSNRIVGPLRWMPPNPDPSDHFCFYIRVVNPQDPITIAEGPSVAGNVAQSNNIAWRNVNVVKVNGTSNLTFQTGNPTAAEADVVLSFEVPERLLEIASVRLVLSPSLQRQWMEAESRGSGFSLAPLPEALSAEEARDGEARQRVLTVNSPTVQLRIPYRASQEQWVRLSFSSSSSRTAEYPVDVVQRIGDETVGGIRYLVRTGPAAGD